MKKIFYLIVILLITTFSCKKEPNTNDNTDQNGNGNNDVYCKLEKTTVTGFSDYIIDYQWNNSTRSYSYSYSASGTTTSVSGYSIFDSNRNEIETSTTVNNGTPEVRINEFDCN